MQGIIVVDVHTTPWQEWKKLLVAACLLQTKFVNSSQKQVVSAFAEWEWTTAPSIQAHCDDATPA